MPHEAHGDEADGELEDGRQDGRERDVPQQLRLLPALAQHRLPHPHYIAAAVRWCGGVPAGRRKLARSLYIAGGRRGTRRSGELFRQQLMTGLGVIYRLRSLSGSLAILRCDECVE